VQQRIGIDDEGRLALSEEQRKRWGLTAGNEVLVRETADGLFIKSLNPLLGKVYIEPTSECNLQCATCVRHSWNEPTGYLPWETYARLIAGLPKIGTCRKIAFWGFGEPLLHPDIVRMVAEAHALGLETEIITNGLLLDEAMAHGLVDAGLDTMVFSIDGTSDESYEDVRSGANLAQVLANIQRLRFIALNRANDDIEAPIGCCSSGEAKPTIGLEFVATKRNVSELPKLRTLARSVGAEFIVVSNVLPYTTAMTDQILYGMSTTPWYPSTSFERRPDITVGRMDPRPEYLDSLAGLVAHSNAVDTAAGEWTTPGGYCRFVGEGAVAISWDGAVSPCPALMHSYRCYIIGREKQIKRYVVGNIGNESIGEIWQKPEFVEFRKHVQLFEFSPCSSCGGCDLAETNEQDCFGNPFPVCGDCLWAKGIIRCP
jgi:radical SAM protein with 4Fe4S-binding SPASM domain